MTHELYVIILDLVYIRVKKLSVQNMLSYRLHKYVLFLDYASVAQFLFPINFDRVISRDHCQSSSFCEANVIAM